MVTLRNISLLCAATAALALTGPAMAEQKNKEVKYEDLDLASDKGQQRLQTRIKYAVKSVCGSPRAMTLAERLDMARCETDAMANAMPKAAQAIAAYQQSRRLAANSEAAIVGN